MKIRFRIQTLIVLTALFAVAFAYYARTELPRMRLIAEIERNGGRISYSDWSIFRPLIGNRVEFVSVPWYGYDNVDTDSLSLFPNLARFGIEDETLRLANGQTITSPAIMCDRHRLSLFLASIDDGREARDFKRKFLPVDVQKNPRPLTEQERESVESAAFNATHVPKTVHRGWSGGK